MPEREIAYGVEQPVVYDGTLFWVGTDGVAFHRFSHHYMQAKAQPFIDAFNAGTPQAFTLGDAEDEPTSVPRETSAGT